MTLGVFHQCFKNLKATEHAISSFRKFHKNNPYVLISDNGDDFSQLAAKYDCHYLHEPINLGYRDHTHPSGIYGMTKDEVLTWLTRFKKACEICKTDFILMMEDDILIRGEINVPEDWDFAGYGLPGNKFQPELMKYLSEKYDVFWNVDYYGTGGGSVFKIKPYIENFERVYKIFNEEFDFIKTNLCGNFGWVDVWMPVYYYLCGKQYTQNYLLTETTSNGNWLNSGEPIVHRYKNYY